MKVMLAATWNPRGEMPRLRRLLPNLLQVYSGMVVILPPASEETLVEEIRQLPGLQGSSWLRIELQPSWSWGRYIAIKEAVQVGADFIQYADLDRLLRWVETRPDEWRQTVELIKEWDCLVIGRTPQSMQTHPQALQRTEAISNQVVSHILGKTVDASAGSKGFSLRAASFLVQHTSPGRALGTDAEWPILLQRAGMRVGALNVDGLDWETADRYQEQAANEEQQRQLARSYDDDPQHWAYRVGVAAEIVDVALDAAQRIIDIGQRIVFDNRAVFDVEDYMYFYTEMLKPEIADLQVAFLLRELGLSVPAEILDLACGFGRHANRLAALGHHVTGIDLMPGFLEIARQEAMTQNLQVAYRQGDMRQIEFFEQFDAVLLLFTAFGYFEDQENEKVLARIARAIKPGGFFIFDTHNRDVILKGLRPSIVTEKEGNLMIDRLEFDSLSGRLYNRRIVIRNGVRRDKPFFVRLYNPSEVHQMLQRAGLRVEKMYSGWDGEPVSADARRMIVIARK
jgi:SAM-dependent methyltransferase